MQQRKDAGFTYADYAAWDGPERYELVDGVPYMMSPSPGSAHQRISVELVRQFANYLKGKTCQVFGAPFDVRLNADAGDDTVVQPDLVIICDPKRIDARGCRGVPDMVVEILSPSSGRHDQVVKFNLYRKAGVREYWIVDPEARTVLAYWLKDGEYVGRNYDETGEVAVGVLEDCVIDLGEVFGPGPEA